MTKRLPRRRRIRALLGTPDLIVDLAEPVDPERDHLRGPVDAPVTVLEYGDFECPYCGQAEPVVRELLREHGEIAYVWRHLPLNDVHPNAQQAAEAAEAAAEQGAFWEMHDLLLDHQDALRLPRSPRLRRTARTRRRALRGGPADANGHRPHRAGRRLGRSFRGLRHAHVLHQRPAALRRVRHRHAVGGSEGRASARARTAHCLVTRRSATSPRHVLRTRGRPIRPRCPRRR